MFQDFLRFYSENKMLELDHELGEFLKSFLRIEPSCKVFKNKMYTKEMRVWDKLSTFPKESYSLSKSIMDKQNPGTKKK